MLVCQLQPGQAFRVGGSVEGFPDTPDFYTDYRMIRVGNGSAYVEPLGKIRRAIKSGDGETLAEFDSPSGNKMHISRETKCIPLDEDGDEDLCGPRVGQDGLVVPIEAKPSSRKVAGADIHHPPQKAQRPVKPGSKREAILKDIQKGILSVDKLAEKHGMKRTLLLAHVWELWNSCGYGYTVVGDKLTIMAPVGHEDDDMGDLL